MLMLWVVVIMLFVGHSNRALYRIVPTFKNMCTALWICSALLCSYREQLVQCTVFLLPMSAHYISQVPILASSIGSLIEH